MPQPPAIFWGNADAPEIDVKPGVSVLAGTVFLDPYSAKYVIPSRDLAAGEISAAYDSGVFRCTKENAADSISAGVTIDFATKGYEESAGPLRTVKASGSGDKYVIAELNAAQTASSYLRSVIKTSEFVALQDIPIGTPINVNGATPAYTSISDVENNYTAHSLGPATGGLLSTEFPKYYGTSFFAFAPLAVEEGDISRANADPTGYVRFSFEILEGTHIRFESQVLEAA